jgi:ORF6C domain
MRDDFSEKTKETLAKRVGMLCANPNCRKLTSGPREDPTKALNIGVAAHITAASPEGPRSDSSLSEAERSSIENGIWLCQNCAKLVDNDETRYTVQLLRQWKQIAEEMALRGVERNTTSELYSQSGKKLKINFTPGPKHIAPETARKLSELVKEIVERLTVSGGDTGKTFARVWSDFNRHFNITTYKELPREKAEAGINYLRQWRASKNSKLRFADPEKFRTAQLRGIWPRSKALGFDDNTLYGFAAQRLKLKSPINSLNELGNQQLAKLNRFLIYEERKAKQH